VPGVSGSESETSGTVWFALLLQLAGHLAQQTMKSEIMMAGITTMAVAVACQYATCKFKNGFS
jgi:hypothetical protein